jgi:ferric-dicitrate binding protein FerR (iron transport regulator)
MLNTSPFEGDLAEELAAEPRPRRRPPSITVLLGAGVLIVGGFVGGVQVDRHWGAKKSSDPAALIRQLAAGRGTQGGGAGGAGGLGGGQAGGQTGGQTGGQGNTQAAGTTGTVKLVDGDTIYVQTPSGIVRVRTSGSTKVTLAKKSTVKALKAGSTVVVQGSPGQDGTVTATSVQGG